MEIFRAGSRPSSKGPEDWFSGQVRVDLLFALAAPSQMSGYLVTFEPGARTAWHTHPLGQTLMITAGCGWVQRDGGPVEVVRPGDVIRFAADERHWHGATDSTGMTHTAVHEAVNGISVTWMEHVTGVTPPA